MSWSPRRQEGWVQAAPQHPGTCTRTHTHTVDMHVLVFWVGSGCPPTPPCIHTHTYTHTRTHTRAHTRTVVVEVRN